MNPHTRLLRATLFTLAACVASCGGQRMLHVTSEPSGALVRLDEEVIGTTPLEHPFEHYGHRRLSLYFEGYRSYSEPIHLKAPWHARFPVDIFTEVLLPLRIRYNKVEHIVLAEESGSQVQESLGTFVERAESLRRGLPGQASQEEASATNEGEVPNATEPR